MSIQFNPSGVQTVAFQGATPKNASVRFSVEQEDTVLFGRKLAHRERLSGVQVEETIQQKIAQAEKDGKSIRFTLNGVDLLVDGQSDAPTVLSIYEREHKALNGY